MIARDENMLCFMLSICILAHKNPTCFMMVHTSATDICHRYVSCNWYGPIHTHLNTILVQLPCRGIDLADYVAFSSSIENSVHFDSVVPSNCKALD